MELSHSGSLQDSTAAPLFSGVFSLLRNICHSKAPWLVLFQILATNLGRRLQAQTASTLCTCKQSQAGTFLCPSLPSVDIGRNTEVLNQCLINNSPEVTAWEAKEWERSGDAEPVSRGASPWRHPEGWRDREPAACRECKHESLGEGE